MKALVKESPGISYQLKDVPFPTPGEGELLVKVKKVALCGTDIAKYKWNEGIELGVYTSIAVRDLKEHTVFLILLESC